MELDFRININIYTLCPTYIQISKFREAVKVEWLFDFNWLTD